MKQAILLLLLLGWTGLLPMHGTEVWIEAESFVHKGGWQTDQQFMDQMGSPYLLAHGMGCPVADATTEVEFPETGEYHAYVRTYNWTSPWQKGKGPGQFRLYVDGRPTGPVLGTEGDRWEWQYAGSVRIRRSKVEVRLKDLTGLDGRCDALYFTTEGAVPPPTDKEPLARLRRHLTGMPDVAPSAGSYDLVVVGAGMAGICAAVSAARLGCRVALIGDRPVVGGNNSSEVRVHLGGRIEVGPYPRLGGLLKEFAPLEGGNAQPEEVYEDDRKMQWLKAQPNVTLFLSRRVHRVDTVEGRIRSVTAIHIEQGDELRFEAPLFADCTGDASVGYLAGADYRMGREGREEFNEPIAPAVADSLTMGSSVQWYSTETDRPTTFPIVEYGIRFTPENCERVNMGEWTWETGMNLHQINDFERIRDYGMLVVYSNWSFLKNRLKENQPWRCRRLEWVAYIAGKRESRRLLGDYILKEEDIRKQVFHEDASFATSWTIDLHFPDTLNSRHFPEGPFKAETNHIPIHTYAVPYRCLYSRNVPNLLMAGRNISVTHVALGTVRVMRTTAMMGEVIGMAASLCKQHDVLPRDVYHHHLDELKELMRQGVGGHGLPNRQHYNEGSTLDEPL
ncbi:MAG: FAD-dependent oxidoreductase [Bacteroides sp.]